VTQRQIKYVLSHLGKYLVSYFRSRDGVLGGLSRFGACERTRLVRHLCGYQQLESRGFQLPFRIVRWKADENAGLVGLCARSALRQHRSDSIVSPCDGGGEVIEASSNSETWLIDVGSNDSWAWNAHTVASRRADKRSWRSSLRRRDSRFVIFHAGGRPDGNLCLDACPARVKPFLFLLRFDRSPEPSFRLGQIFHASHVVGHFCPIAGGFDPGERPVDRVFALCPSQFFVCDYSETLGSGDANVPPGW
jgi:hypothetical protein